MNDVDQAELDLLAQRYVTGELSGRELADFEARLAVDQVARDAVEFAVRIALLSASAAPLAVAGSTASWRSVAAAALVLAVAALGYGLGWFGRGAPPPGDPLATSAETEAQVLIASWMAFGELADVDTVEAETERLELMVDFEAGEAPDWMMRGLVK